MDLFIVPTIGFNLLYAFVIVRLDRRDLVWINVTANPTAEWIARQLTEAFPWNEAPHYLIRDRDRIYGTIVRRRLRAMGIRDKPTAPASPWQNGFAERLIGSIRRECLDHIIVLGEAHLRRILRAYACYYNTSERTGHWTKMRRSLAGSADRDHSFTHDPWRASSPLCSGLGSGSGTQPLIAAASTAPRVGFGIEIRDVASEGLNPSCSNRLHRLLICTSQSPEIREWEVIWCQMAD